MYCVRYDTAIHYRNRLFLEGATIMKEKTLNVSEAVVEALDQAKAENRPLPTLRGLRAQIGGGSLTTISEAVKQWRLSQLQADEGLPQGFDEKTSAEIADVVWKAVLPVLQEQIEGVRKNADARIEAERTETAKLRAVAAETLAEASAMNDEYDVLKAKEQELREALAKAEGELQELRKTLEATQKELVNMREERDHAFLTLAAVRSTQHTLEKLASMIDPKYLKEQQQSK